MKTAPDINAYFSRIGYNGDAGITPETLRELHMRHPQTFAFENLNPLLGIPVNLDLESLQTKLVGNGRGGYCFEQNLLFQHVLETLGFNVRGLGARIMWNRPSGEFTSRGHMLLLIELDGDNWIADVGFGGLGPTAPLLLKPDIIQSTPHESYRLTLSDGDYILQSHIKGEWKNLYRFGLEKQYLPDYELTNWYLSNHPESHFVTGLFAARPEPGRRYALHNNEYAIHHMNGNTEKHTIKSASELKQILEQRFLLTLPETPVLDEKLLELVQPEEQSAAHRQ